MKIRLIYTGGLSKVTKQGREDLELDKIESVGELLDELVLIYGEGFKKFVFPSSKEKFAIPILCNGVFCKSETKIKDGDSLVFSFIAKGG